VALCEDLGILAIVEKSISKKEWKKLSDEEVIARFKAKIEKTESSDALLGFYIVDEPGASFFPQMALAVQTVKELMPGKLAYINLFPSYATLGAPNLSQLETKTFDEYLERYISEVKPQFLSYDDYKVQYSNDLENKGQASIYWRDLLTFREKALEHDLDFWNIVSSNQIRPSTPPPSPANLLFQAYTTLAAGGKGVSWYTYFGRGYGYGPVDREWKRTVSWNYLKMVNEQLKVIGPMMMNLESTGVYFTEPVSVDCMPTLPGDVVDSATADQPLMIGEFKDPDGGSWAMIVNLSLDRSTKFSFSSSVGGESTRHYSPVDGSALKLEAENSLWLTAGQGVLIKF